MVTEMTVMRENDKKIQRCDDQTNKNGPLLRSFFFLKKGMALSHLPNDANNNARPSMEKKRKSSFWPIGGCGYPAIPASGNIGRSDESFSVPFP